MQCEADPFQNLIRGFVIPPLKLGREWIVIFHSFVWVYLFLHVSTPMMVKLLQWNPFIKATKDDGLSEEVACHEG